MQPKTLKLLEDILAAGATIERHTHGSTEAQYRKDERLRGAVERWCETIGEAVRRIKAEDPECFERIPAAQRVIDFRNVISHGYDVVDDHRVWLIVLIELPRLLAAVQALIAEKTDGP